MTPTVGEVTVDGDALARLRARLGDEHVGRRLRMQVEQVARVLGRDRRRAALERGSALGRAVRMGLELTALTKRGVANALDLRLREHRVPIRRLPAAFEGFTILHLSDVHLDGHPELVERIAELIRGVRFDVAVITGDFRFHDVGSYGHLATLYARLAPRLRGSHGVFGVLGNHDCLEMVPLLEAAGVRMLVNESVALRRGVDTLWLVGLDDAHRYRSHDLDRALAGVPVDAARVLLAHSPEVVEEASERGIDLYLTGHTHGGQLCLPGGWPLFINARAPRRYARGAWTRRGMRGYTSTGTGSSGVFARFFSPPEVVLHHLGAT